MPGSIFSKLVTWGGGGGGNGRTDQRQKRTETPAGRRGGVGSLEETGLERGICMHAVRAQHFP